MVNQKKEVVSVSQKKEKLLDWIVIGAFAVIMALLLLNF